MCLPLTTFYIRKKVERQRKNLPVIIISDFLVIANQSNERERQQKALAWDENKGFGATLLLQETCK